MSRTDQYRKVMKPLLERKRRARINGCLDELKDLKRQQMLALNPGLDLDRFHAGYTACATEVSKCLASTGVDITVGSRLMSHLGHKLNTIETSRVAPLKVRVPSSPSSDCGYSSGRDSTPSPSCTSSPTSGLLQISPAIKQEHQQQISPVWRPF